VRTGVKWVVGVEHDLQGLSPYGHSLNVSLLDERNRVAGNRCARPVGCCKKQARVLKASEKSFVLVLMFTSPSA
jgi:hypothetical protein